MIAQTPVVLWDLDGTILDPAGAITDGIADALCTCGFSVPENLGRFVGPPIGESLRHFTDVPEDRIPQVISVYRAGYLTEGLQRTRVYPGIEKELDRLRALGVRQVVATQKPERIAVEVVQRFGLSAYFDTVSGAADDLARPAAGRVSLHDKPEIIGEALDRLGLSTPDSERTVMIGDRSYDAEGAHAHGLDCIGAGWGFGQPGELDDVCVAVVGAPAGLAAWTDRYNDSAEGQSDHG
ncbi:HAD hydrolase-like protein [Kocuria sp.]|uniref:HAD hydrolase-like protein n=1 Tax=Kocuria sp. TaxID=1871328 RepID=UPI0026E0CC65|nr:HAD hydrolase-like protein [Kocuria sp.]MDO5366738.1 HAD hydrolase-like protein [Kocuria sp.]